MKSVLFGRELHVRAARRRDLPAVMAYTTVPRFSCCNLSAFSTFLPFFCYAFLGS